LLAEFVGTGLLVAVVIGSGIAAQRMVGDRNPAARIRAISHAAGNHDPRMEHQRRRPVVGLSADLQIRAVGTGADHLIVDDPVPGGETGVCEWAGPGTGSSCGFRSSCHRCSSRPSRRDCLETPPTRTSWPTSRSRPCPPSPPASSSNAAAWLTRFRIRQLPPVSLLSVTGRAAGATPTAATDPARVTSCGRH